MNLILKENPAAHSYFFLVEGDDKLAEMEIKISAGEITVYHTEVYPHAEGKGLGKKMFLHLVEYARQNGLKIKAYCPFVRSQLQRDPESYKDIWNPSTVS